MSDHVELTIKLPQNLIDCIPDIVYLCRDNGDQAYLMNTPVLPSKGTLEKMAVKRFEQLENEANCSRETAISMIVLELLNEAQMAILAAVAESVIKHENL